MNVLSTTAERVTVHTDAEINARIRRDTEKRVRRLAAAGPEAIGRRLGQLNREWDVERCLETGASSLMLIGSLLGVGVDRKWFLLPVGVAAFLLQHALQGWCPPLPVFRRLGVRTAEEINEERYALKALKGDFQPASVAAQDLPSAEIALAGSRIDS